MNRRLYILILASAVCCLLIFTLYPSFRLSESYSFHASRDDKSNQSPMVANGKKKAFATIICDPSMMEATLVSVHSLNIAFAQNPLSKSEVIILLPDSIELNANDTLQLEKLGGEIIKSKGLHQQNDCDNTMLNLWALFDYQKIVYFTPDIVFDNNVNHLFNYPAGAAIKSNDAHTPSLVVLEPNPNSFKSLVKGYRKAYNLMSLLEHDKLIDYNLKLSTDQLSKNLVAYTGPMKPWNFHSYADVDWKKHYDPVSFYKWRRINNAVRQMFNQANNWSNVARQRTVCDSYLKSMGSTNISSYPIHHQFSVMISTYNPERIESLSLLIRNLLKSKKVHTVFITWHNPKLEVPSSLYTNMKKKDVNRLKVLTQTFDSLNNRFNPTSELMTDAVYIMDDDIYVDVKDLEFAFSVWRSRKDSVVGHFPRAHTYDPETKHATYYLISKAPYSIILTKSMFTRSDYLFSYTCLLEPKLHESVDGQLNCEDLGFAMMASGISSAASTFVRPQKPMEDFGLTKGISTNSAHMPARADCVSDFITQFWNAKDPLVKSYNAVAPFSKPVIRVGNWDRVQKAVSH